MRSIAGRTPGEDEFLTPRGLPESMTRFRFTGFKARPLGGIARVVGIRHRVASVPSTIVEAEERTPPEDQVS